MNKFNNYRLWKDIESVVNRLPEITMDSIFVNFRFTASLPCSFEFISNFWFQSLDEAICYFKFMIVRQAIIDCIPEIDNTENLDLDALFNDEKAFSKYNLSDYLPLWNGINAVLSEKEKKSALNEYLERFNNIFAHADTDFEVHFAYGVNEIRVLLENNYDGAMKRVFMEATDKNNFDPAYLRSFLLEY